MTMINQNLWLIATALLRAVTAYHDADSTRYCPIACSVLSRQLPGMLVTSSDTTTYQRSKDAYYTTFNSALSPACFVSPIFAKDVATIVKTARSLSCPFAVKSGSHTFFAGSSNIQDGITINLQSLNEISPNKVFPGTVSIGPGSRWGQVYDKLDPLNITVLGGRVADVGVGGLLLSGGLSFFQPQSGFACDSVYNYQVVTADGKILEVNQDTYPDLYWVLRGGGSNFGVVTRFDVEAFPHGKLWGGSMVYNFSQLDALLPAFSRLAAGEDLKATTWLVPYYQPKLDLWIISSQPMYTDPVPLDSPPEIFKHFLDAPHLASDIRVDNIASFTREMNLSIQTTQAEWVITQRFNTDVIYYFIKQINDWKDLRNTTITGVSIDFQILSKQALAKTATRGGNSMGLSAKDGPLLIIHFMMTWPPNSTVAETTAFYEKGDAIIAEVEKWGMGKGLVSRYIYQNYAGPKQDVYGGYGKKNLRRLKQVARKYDPEGVFQKLMPGDLNLK